MPKEGMVTDDGNGGVSGREAEGVKEEQGSLGVGGEGKGGEECAGWLHAGAEDWEAAGSLSLRSAPQVTSGCGYAYDVAVEHGIAAGRRVSAGC